MIADYSNSIINKINDKYLLYSSHIFSNFKGLIKIIANCLSNTRKKEVVRKLIIKG